MSEFDVLVVKVEEAARIAGAEDPPHDLHVLLRHRLLREPGGFEGLLAVVEQLHLSDLAVGERPDRHVRRLYRRTAGASNLALATDRQNLAARLCQLIDLEIDLAEDGDRVAPEPPHTFVSPVDGLHPHGCSARVRDIPHDVLGVDLEGRHAVTPGDRVVDSADDLDVLLRHRLLPQPGGVEGLGLGEKDLPPDALPVPPLGKLPDRLLERSLATCAMPTQAERGEGQVSEVAHFDDPDGYVRENVEEVFPPAADSGVAV